MRLGRRDSGGHFRRMGGAVVRTRASARASSTSEPVLRTRMALTEEESLLDWLMPYPEKNRSPHGSQTHTRLLICLHPIVRHTKNRLMHVQMSHRHTHIPTNSVGLQNLHASLHGKQLRNASTPGKFGPNYVSVGQTITWVQFP